MTFSAAALNRAAPVEEGGTWIDCDAGAGTTRIVKPNLIWVGSLEQIFLSGPLNGVFAGIERDVVGNFNSADSSATFHGSGTYAGTYEISVNLGP